MQNTTRHALDVRDCMLLRNQVRALVAAKEPVEQAIAECIEYAQDHDVPLIQYLHPVKDAVLLDATMFDLDLL